MVEVVAVVVVVVGGMLYLCGLLWWWLCVYVFVCRYLCGDVEMSRFFRLRMLLLSVFFRIW